MPKKKQKRKKRVHRDHEEELVLINENWFDETFSSLGTLFGSFEYFSNHIRKHFPAGNDPSATDPRSLFLLEEIDLVWDPQLSQPSVQVAFASNRLRIRLPDHNDYTPEQKEDLCHAHLERYFMRLKESHLLTLALIWRLLDQQARSQLIALFAETEDPDLPANSKRECE